MAIGPIELHGTVLRSQDYTSVKHQQDNQAAIQQAQFGQELKKEVENKLRQVNQSDKPEYQQKKFDAKEKGSNQYQGDGGKKREKRQDDGKVIPKSSGGFDIKI